MTTWQHRVNLEQPTFVHLALKTAVLYYFTFLVLFKSIYLSLGEKVKLSIRAQFNGRSPKEDRIESVFQNANSIEKSIYKLMFQFNQI